jgi:hypothetical protein
MVFVNSGGIQGTSMTKHQQINKAAKPGKKKRILQNCQHHLSKIHSVKYEGQGKW